MDENRRGIWVINKGVSVFVPEGETLEKASYMVASQESPVKQDLTAAPHYVVTAKELSQTQPFNAGVGEDVRYDSGMKKGILITVDRSFAKILKEDRTGYDFVHISDVHKSDDYTRFGLWSDIPDHFRLWMLKTAGIPEEYLHRDWSHMPKVIKDTLKDTGNSSVFETTARTGTQSNPSAINGYDGAEETEHEKRKHADGVNTNNPARGTNGKLINPQDNKRRDGRQVVDNEEQNNTFSAGEEDPEEPYTANIRGGSNHKEEYGNSLGDWRAAKPKQDFSDYKVDVDPKVDKVDSGVNAFQGENRSLAQNPKEEIEKEDEEVEKAKYGVPSSDVINYGGVKYLSNKDAIKWMQKKNQAEKDSWGI